MLTLNCYLLIQTYEIKSEDLYEQFFKRKHLFDFSNFLKGSRFHDSQKEMVVSKMKNIYKVISINKCINAFR